MRLIRTLKSGNLSEDSIQKTVMEWVSLQPTLNGLVIHVPNEGRRTHNFGKNLKAMGMRAGVPDLFIMMARRGFNGAWIELKSKDGVLSTLQKKFIQDARAQNYYAEVCHTIEDAIKIIKWYCFADNLLASCCLHRV